ncbi:MAG: DUF4124 domain-containing protein [Gammaproteobacteria bacterium]
MTLKHWLITGALAVTAIPAGAELYRWVDASGTVHYSDMPREGAEVIVLKPTNVIPGRPARRSRSSNRRLTPSNDGTTEPDVPLPYTAVTITSPSEDETVWNTGGTLNVQIGVEPFLQEGHGIVLVYDGRIVNDEPVRSTSITVNNVFRGQHSVRASIKDQEGNTVFDGGSVTFFVQQTSTN